jgi:hypothetical protein
LTQERVRAGFAAVRRRGRRGGHPVAIDAEKMAAVIAALEGGATKAALPDRSGNRHCLVGAAMHFSAKLGLPYDPVISLLQSALPRRQMGLVFFNDHHCRSIDELRAVIPKALTVALENAEQERAASALHRRFVAELEQERAARRAAGDSRETYVLCPRARLDAITPYRRAA